MTEQFEIPKDNPTAYLNPNEAPASLNFYGVTKNGWNCQFTLRDLDEMALMRRFAAFVGELTKWGVTPKPVGQQPASKTEAPAASADTSTGSVHEPHSEGVGVDFFEAETLAGSVNDGKVFWKVKGGKFTKWGVNIWPEVLKDAGFNVDDLNPMKTYPLGGMRAYYQTTVKDGKENLKVTKLVKS